MRGSDTDSEIVLGIVDGGLVKLSSRRGSFNFKAAINRRAAVQKGMVFVPFFDEKSPINDLTLDAFCPMSKEPDYKKCAVKVEKA